MEITEVRVKLMDDPDDRLQAFCSITIDDWFVVRDLKIIDGTSGPFVAMPSRKLTMHCRKCRYKNHLRANFCNQCGAKLQQENTSRSESRDSGGRVKLYADIAHPINSECREAIQKQVIAEFEAELELAQDPNYVSRYDDGIEDAYFDNPESADSDVKKVNPQGSKTGTSHRIESSERPSGPHSTSGKPGEPAHVKAESQRPSARRPSENTNQQSSAGHSPDDSQEDDAFGAGLFD